MTNYWTKDQSKQEIITKTKISTQTNFNLFANYFNLLDAKGIGFQLSKEINFPDEKLFRKNGFEYIILELNEQRELFILPNDNIVEYTNRIVSKLDACKTEKEVLDLLVEEM